MKKSLSRILSLALVLAMLVSAVPFALAADSGPAQVKIDAPESIKPGETLTVTAVVTDLPENAENVKYTWFGNAVGTETTAVYVVPKDTEETEVSGSVVVTYTYKEEVPLEEGDEGYVENGSGTKLVEKTGETSDVYQVAIKTEAKPVPVTKITITSVDGKNSVSVGKTLQLTAAVEPENATNKEVIWKSSDEQTATVSQTGLVTGVKAGKSVTITATAKDGNGSISGSFSVEVTESTYQVILSETELTVNTGEDVALLKLTVKDGDKELSDKDYSVEWESSDKDVVTVTDGKITALKKGTGTITATVTINGLKLDPVACKVTVNEVTVACEENANVAVKGTVTLDPQITGLSSGAITKITSCEYTSADTKIATVGKTTGKVTGVSVGITTIHMVAKYDYYDTSVKGWVSAEAQGDVLVSVYSQPTLEVTLKDGKTSFRFDDTKVFSKVNGKTDDADESMYALLIAGISSDWYNVKFTTSSATGSTSVGKLDAMSAEGLYLRYITFTATRSGDFNAQYTFYNKEGLILAIGDLTIHVGGSAGDIVYETDYKTDVTFDEDDFEDFWNSIYTAANNTLKYVEFGVGTSVPAYGELYTTTGKTKTVTSTMKFQPNYASSSLYYDLDTVTYEPSTRYTSAYTVEIPFTAYGGTGTTYATKLEGTVVIELNGASTDITSRGVIFGTGTYSIADMMADDYEEAMKDKNVELAYVTFILPDVEDGRLYYNYDGILDSDRVSSKEDYYVEPGTKQLDLEKVAFIPAAGTTGRVTIEYIGYDKNGTNPYEGKVVLNVTAKTKSAIFNDVTATSYSWAADSIDFLYYEEVVNGTSSTKFGPASSITRGDFMIMLYRAFLEEDWDDYNVTSNFADVPKGTSAYEKETYQAVGVAKYLGIAKGNGTNFNPKASITREEAMTLIYRTLDEVDLDLEYTSTKTTGSFSDYSKVSTYAQTSITYLIKHGIVIGSNGLINPKSNITRAEMAVILHRVLTY